MWSMMGWTEVLALSFEGIVAGIRSCKSFAHGSLNGNDLLKRSDRIREAGPHNSQIILTWISVPFMKIHNPLCHGERREFMIMSRFWFVRDSIDNWAKLLPLSIYGVTSSSSACTPEVVLFSIIFNLSLCEARRVPTSFFRRADLNPSEPCLPHQGLQLFTEIAWVEDFSSIGAFLLLCILYWYPYAKKKATGRGRDEVACMRW